MATKAELTRQKIVDAAFDLFLQQGYDKTTMRAIAQHAGVSLGNAYYYFDSKEALMQGYYEEIQRRFADEVGSVLSGETSFAKRLEATLLSWVNVAAPFHEFAGEVFPHAAKPTSPLSPFSEESRDARARNMAVFQEVIDGSRRLKMAPEVRERLAELLWMYLMGVVLYWVHDRSAKQKNTRTLINKTVPLVTRLISMSQLPVLRKTARDVMALIDSLTKKDSK